LRSLGQSLDNVVANPLYASFEDFKRRRADVTSFNGYFSATIQAIPETLMICSVFGLGWKSHRRIVSDGYTRFINISSRRAGVPLQGMATLLPRLQQFR
jgi:hypothetical protein